MDIDFDYLMKDWDRHGTGRIYVRYGGRKIRLRAAPGTPEFAEAYANALYELQHNGKKRPQLTGAAAGTMGWLAACYFASPEFRGLSVQSQTTRRAIIEECLREPRRPGSADVIRDCPVNVFTAQHVKMLRDRKANTPGAANNRKKYLSAWFGWAIEQSLMPSNPARDVKRIKYATNGFHPWTIDEVRQFEERHPIGSKARLALALLLFLGVRRSDVVHLGKQHTKDGWIRFVPQKTKHKRRDVSEKPILPILADIIAKSPTGDLTYLETNYGRPFSAVGFSAWFKDRCREAKLHHCSAHGLRKAGATIAANNGASDRMLMALFDWTSSNQATTYTKAADKKRLTAAAAQLVNDQMANSELPHPLPHQNLRVGND